MFIRNWYHRIFRVPYSLHIAADTKNGQPVIFLHGIASDSGTWRYVLPLLPPEYRAISIDLLGFGQSPKPKDSNYSTAAHTATVLKTIKKLGVKSAIIVGHSMGGLIAVELAKKHPKLVRGIILVSVPLYNPGDIINATSQYRANRWPNGGLFAVYERLIDNERLTLKAAQAAMKLAPNYGTFALNKDTWEPFKHSLTNTIMKQNSMIDMFGLHIPITIMYGKLDLLIQAKNYDTLTATQPGKFTIRHYSGAHMINKNAAIDVTDAIIQVANSLEDVADSKVAAKAEG